MKNLIIIGAGGFAREIYWHAQKSIGFGVEWRIKGFLDGDIKLAAAEYELLPEKVLATLTATKFARTIFLPARLAVRTLGKFLSKKFYLAAANS